MRRVYTGAIMIVGGIALFIYAHRHVPVPQRAPEVGLITPASGLSDTAYDLVRVGGWALVILGAVTVALGLIRYATRSTTADGLAGTPDTAGISANGASRPDGKRAPAGAPSPKHHPAATPWDEGSHGEAVQPSPRN